MTKPLPRPDAPVVYPPIARTQTRNRIVGVIPWALAQREYLAGASGPQCCDRHGMTLAAFRKRASRKGWTKRAAAEAMAEAAGLTLAGLAAAGGPLSPEPLLPGPLLPEPLLPGAASPEPRVAARRALLEAARLACAGRMAQAIEAARVADLLARTALRLEAGGMDDDDDAPSDEEILNAVRARVVALAEEARERAEGSAAGESGPEGPALEGSGFNPPSAPAADP